MILYYLIFLMCLFRQVKKLSPTSVSRVSTLVMQ